MRPEVRAFVEFYMKNARSLVPRERGRLRLPALEELASRRLRLHYRGASSLGGWRWTGEDRLQGRFIGVDWRSAVFSRRIGSLWPSAGAAMRGMAREYAAGNSRGPGWHEFAGKFCREVGSVAGSSGSGMARSRASSKVRQSVAPEGSPRPGLRYASGKGPGPFIDQFRVFPSL